MHPLDVTETIGGKRYSTETATLLAGNDWWDGHNWERSGTNTFLYRTPRGNYFLHHRSRWQGANDGEIEPIEVGDAMEQWESLRERRVGFEDAFPDIEVQDA